jgi:hypothetical protein
LFDQYKEIDIKYTVDFPAPGDTDILWRNIATVDALTEGRNPVDDDTYVEVTQRKKLETPDPVTPAAITLTKSSNTTTVPAGGNAANPAPYTLVIENTGDAALTGIAIEDYFLGKLGFAPACDYVFANTDAKATVNKRINGFTVDFDDTPLESGGKITFAYTVVFPENKTGAGVDWHNIATVTATPDGGDAQVRHSDYAEATQSAGGGGGSGGGGGIGGGEKGTVGGEKGTVGGGGRDDGGGNGKITSPGGNGPIAPPRPTSPDNSLIPGPNGTYIEIDEDGARIGEWHWDDLTAQWIFDAYMPLGVLPQTGATLPAGEDGHARGAAHMILPAVRKDAEGNEDNDGAVV